MDFKEDPSRRGSHGEIITPGPVHDESAALFLADLPCHRASRDEVITFVVDFIRRHGQIRSGDYLELFGVSKAHAARLLRDLTTAEWGAILRPGRTPNVGRDADYVAGPGFPPDGSA